MVELENTLISDDIFETQFLCDLQKCKGGCCKDGDVGAPITTYEIDIMQKHLPAVLTYLPEKNVQSIKENSYYAYDDEFGYVTLCDEDSICIFGYLNATGQIVCSFEKAYHDKKIDFPKPLSCHLFPIRIDRNEKTGTEMLNYEPRQKLCDAACKKGKEISLPLFQFLKHAIVRKFGESYYSAMEQIYYKFFTKKKKS